MPQSLSMNIIHLIYSTKNRVASLPPTIRSRLHAYQPGDRHRRRSRSCPCVVERASDGATKRRSDEATEGTKVPSKWIKTQRQSFAGFSWQNGYGAFSVSQSQVAHVRRYIEKQEERHRTTTFQEEFRAFLRRHRLEFDERYVWD